MGNILGSWSGMRKYLEKEMLAESLRGRVRYHCTSYVGADLSNIFSIFIDEELIKRFSYATVTTYFVENGYKEVLESGYWDKLLTLLDDTVPLESRTEYTHYEFCDALEKYRNQSIRDSINSENPLVRMFAVLDRRVGKRTLAELKNSVEEQPEWLQLFYQLRISAEKI